MPRIIWTAAAVHDVKRLFNFLAQKNSEAAKRAASQIKQTADQLVDIPKIGRPMPDSTSRREIFTTFGGQGYVIRYIVDDKKNPVIIRVWHYREKR